MWWNAFNFIFNFFCKIKLFSNLKNKSMYFPFLNRMVLQSQIRRTSAILLVTGAVFQSLWNLSKCLVDSQHYFKCFGLERPFWHKTSSIYLNFGGQSSRFLFFNARITPKKVPMPAISRDRQHFRFFCQITDVRDGLNCCQPSGKTSVPRSSSVFTDKDLFNYCHMIHHN